MWPQLRLLVEAGYAEQDVADAFISFLVRRLGQNSLAGTPWTSSGVWLPGYIRLMWGSGAVQAHQA